jgi:hypothetical protein
LHNNAPRYCRRVSHEFWPEKIKIDTDSDQKSKTAWGIRFDYEPRWATHMLDEPEEVMRELVGDEGDRIDDAVRADYEPFFAFARAAGLRLTECILRWSEVDWGAGQIRKKGKGRRTVVAPITPAVRAILRPLRGHHKEFVFTYVAERTRSGRTKGSVLVLRRRFSRPSILIGPPVSQAGGRIASPSISARPMLVAERARAERLMQIIKELQRHRFGRRAETLPEDQLLLGLEDVEQGEASREAAVDITNAVERSGRAAARRRNRGSLPSHLPRIEMGDRRRRSRVSVLPRGAAPDRRGRRRAARHRSGPVPGAGRASTQIRLPSLRGRGGAGRNPGTPDRRRAADRLNAVLCERCLAMGFHPWKARRPGQSSAVTMSGSRGALHLNAD